MEAKTLARKENLAALRKRKMDQSAEREGKLEGQDDRPSFRFRNYSPMNEDLQAQSQMAKPADANLTVEQEVEGITKIVLEDAERKQTEELDLFNIAPKRPNWDLKRDVEKKLARLERRTQVAIAELIRKRLQAETNNTDSLADAIAMGNISQVADDDDDDED